MPMKAFMYLIDHRGKRNGQAGKSGKDEFLVSKERRRVEETAKKRMD